MSKQTNIQSFFASRGTTSTVTVETPSAADGDEENVEPPNAEAFTSTSIFLLFFTLKK